MIIIKMKYLPYAKEKEYIVASTPWQSLEGVIVNPFRASANWYKRLYNNVTTLYNNIAADANYILTPKVSSPQTRLTWRKITADINPANYNLTIAEVKKPEKYLQWVNWEIVAKIVDPNPTEIKVVPATEVVNNTDIKKTIAKWLSSLVKKWKVADNVSKIQKLIDLYNKVK